MVPPYFIYLILPLENGQIILICYKNTQCFHFQAFRMPNACGTHGNAKVGMALCKHPACQPRDSPARRGTVPGRESRGAALLPPRRWRAGTAVISPHGTRG